MVFPNLPEEPKFESSSPTFYKEKKIKRKRGGGGEDNETEIGNKNQKEGVTVATFFFSNEKVNKNYSFLYISHQERGLSELT